MKIISLTSIITAIFLSLKEDEQHPQHGPGFLRQLTHRCGPWIGTCCTSGGMAITNCYAACVPECQTLADLNGVSDCNDNSAACGGSAINC